jgi:SAM-dependent methyltransferase
MNLKYQKNLKKEFRQINLPYQSTVDFNNFIKKNNGFASKSRVLDAGCGIGNNTIYFAKKNKSVKFIGGDYSLKNISLAKKIFKNYNNISFVYMDMLKKNKKFINAFDGIISIHTMCCFKDIEKPIKLLCNLNPKWMCIKTLAFKADLDVLIHIRDFDSGIKDNNPDGDFNIFSEKKIIKAFQNNNYSVKIFDYFPRNKIIIKNKNKRGSYTVKTQFNKNTVFSGPVYLPWKFIFAKKKNV